MYVSFVKAIDRKTGKGKTLAEAVTLTHDQAAAGKVRDMWNEINAAADKGRELRKLFSHATCTLLNTNQGVRVFKDKDAKAEKARREAKAAAESEALQKAQAALEAAQEAASKARADLIAAGGTPDDVAAQDVIKKLEAERDELLRKLEESTKEETADAPVETQVGDQPEQPLVSTTETPTPPADE